MAQKDPLTEYLEKAAEDLETNKDETTAVGSATVYPDPPALPERNTKAVTFSDLAQESAQDIRKGVPERLLSSPASSNAAEHALIGNVLATKDYETSNVQLKPKEKISHPRAQTLMEMVARISLL